jgi:predicted secreted protein
VPSGQGPDRSLNLRISEEALLEFEGLGGAGYRWRAEVAGDPGVVSIDWRVGPLADDATRKAGVSAPEIAIVRAERAGEVTISFFQQRPWEKGVDSLRKQLVTVRVAAASASVT